MRSIYLIDNSVLQRAHRSPEVVLALRQLVAAGDLGSCLPQLLEEGYSARTATEHVRLLAARQAAGVFLDPIPAVARIALDIQQRLFRAGKGRSVGVSDLQIAATAVAYSDDEQTVTVVHYDADFEHVADVLPDFHQRWVLARGSVA